MVANEIRIAVMLFGLSASVALAQDVAAGETSFRKCGACHSIGVGAQNKIGPLLNGIDGRKCGSAGGDSYSEANRNCPTLHPSPYPQILAVRDCADRP
jgi:cytochrome c